VERFFGRSIRPRLLSLALLGALLTAPGCGGGSAPSPGDDGKKGDKKDDGGKNDSNPSQDSSKQETKTPSNPRSAMLQAIKGLVTGNEEQLWRVVKADDKQKELLRAMMQFEVNAHAFQTAFIKEYGVAAWKRFNDPAIEHGKDEGNTTLLLRDLKQEQEEIGKFLLVDKDSDRVTCNYTDQWGKTVHLTAIKESDGWRVDAASMLPEGDYEQHLKKFRTQAALVKKYQKAIRKDIKPDDLDVELGKAIVKELLGTASSKPPRFDIDKLKD
jgi:hypothetical protein